MKNCQRGTKQFKKSLNELKKNQSTKEMDLWVTTQVLVLVNPYGGDGKALNIWKLLMIPSFQKFNIKYECILTSTPTDAYDKMISYKIESFQRIVIVSGDGMFHQVINGLLDRFKGDVVELRNFVNSTPLCIIPAGTMNGLSSSLGNKTPEEALIKFLSGTTSQYLDCYKITSQDSSQARIDCHVFSSCIIADHDQYLEHDLRVLPSWLRSNLAPAIVIAKCPSYKAVLNLKPLSVTPEETKKFGFRNGFSLGKDFKGRTDWRTIEDEFVMFSISNTDMGASNILFVPGAKSNDGSLYILIIRKGVTRARLLQIFLAFETGYHINYPEIEIYRVEALEYTPISGSGNMTLSGETFKYGPIQVEVLPRQFRITC